MKNSIENKKRFVCLYYGQNIMRYEGWKNDFDILELDGKYYRGYGADPASVNDKSYLELKSLDEISKKDLQAIGFRFPKGYKGIKINFTPNNYHLHWSASSKDGYREGFMTLNDFDYLRSEGYALPWKDLTIEKQIKYGWIKIKGKEQ